MRLRMPDLIAKKRDGLEHSAGEIGFISRAAADGSVPDYQLSAWLMAVRLNGMTRAETVTLTRAMAASGSRLDLSSVRGAKVDKHSTGGVGDGISLALAPLAAAAGLRVPMMSGRGLGHTGGTLDKLEAVPGLKVRLPAEDVARMVREIGVCMFGQTGNLAPADKKLYALRDATATVESIPLITASILSKKLAEDLDGLLMDVKFGSGAFMRDPADAEELGRSLVRTAEGLGLRCVGLLTAMEQPLGRAVGNALEMRQAIDVLRGDTRPSDFVELLLVQAGWLAVLAGKARGWEEGARRMERLIKGGQALDKLTEMVARQGGSPGAVDDPGKAMPVAPLSLTVAAGAPGFVTRLDAKAVGLAAVALGAGRAAMEDKIDFGAGVMLERKLGDRVAKGEIIARCYASDKERLADGGRLLEAAVSVGPRRPAPVRLVRKVLTAGRARRGIRQ